MQIEKNKDTISLTRDENSIHYEIISNEEMNIYVYQPLVELRYIKLNSQEPISILNKIYPYDSIYIFNGQTLDIQKSFHFYNIYNNHIIILLKSSIYDCNPRLIDKWLRLTRDNINLNKRIYLNFNNSTRRELSKIRDIKLNKTELKRRECRRYYKSKYFSQLIFNISFANDYTKNKDINEIIENTDLNIKYISFDSPSNDPLPIIW